MSHRTPEDQLVLGIPTGSLQTAAMDLFARAGYDIRQSGRSYSASIDDPQMAVLMFRAQEMSRYVEDGIVDVGLTGSDWIRENESDVVEICELPFSKATSRPAKWVLAVPDESPVQRPEDLEGGIIATELLSVTRNYFAEKGVNVKVEFSWGATEAKARLLDGIVDVTETGGSIRANKLRVLDELLVSTPRLIANHQTLKNDWKKQTIENLATLLKGALDARDKVGMKLNVPKDKLPTVLALLPSEKSPTVSNLVESDWLAVEVVVEESVERQLVPQLKRAGATGIISYPLNKVIP